MSVSVVSQYKSILGRVPAAWASTPARSTRISPASTSAYVPTNAEIKPSLGRNLAACPVRRPPRVTLRRPRSISFRRTRCATTSQADRCALQPHLPSAEDRIWGNARVGQIDVYNLLNASTVLNENTVRVTNNQWMNALQSWAGACSRSASVRILRTATGRVCRRQAATRGA
jgi:hypothetical protein